VISSLERRKGKQCLPSSSSRGNGKRKGKKRGKGRKPSLRERFSFPGPGGEGGSPSIISTKMGGRAQTDLRRKSCLLVNFKEKEIVSVFRGRGGKRNGPSMRKKRARLQIDLRKEGKTFRLSRRGTSSGKPESSNLF